MASPTFTLMSSSLVTASSPTQRHPMFLSAIDIFWRWFPYTQGLLFYQLDCHVPQAYDSFIHRLKSSLSLALVDFYPLAGRLFVQQDGRLALDCNNAGVEFLEVSVDEPFLPLADDGFQHRTFFRQLAPMGDVLKWDQPELPLLSVQVTRFKDDGGIALGLAHCHVVADGHSFWHFVKSWGECARGMPISMPPLHIRTELRREKLICPAPEKGVQSVTSGAALDLPPPKELAQRDFHFSASMVKVLKQRAAENEGAAFTSFEALCAHVWKHITAARGVSDATKSGIFVIANYRRRLVPPLPDAYFGNAIHREVVSVRAGELQQESLGKTAKRVHELIITMDDRFFRESAGKVEVLDAKEALAAGMEEGMVLVNVGNSPRFPVYEVEFGWGKATCVRTARMRGDGDIMLFAGKKGGGSVDVCVALPPPTMQRLLQNTAFLSLQ